jgi:nucleoid-associated protein YgaU
MFTHRRATRALALVSALAALAAPSGALAQAARDVATSASQAKIDDTRADVAPAGAPERYASSVSAKTGDAKADVNTPVVPVSTIADTKADVPGASRAPSYEAPSRIEIVRPERIVVGYVDQALPIALAGAIALALGGLGVALAAAGHMPRSVPPRGHRHHGRSGWSPRRSSRPSATRPARRRLRSGWDQEPADSRATAAGVTYRGHRSCSRRSDSRPAGSSRTSTRTEGALPIRWLMTIAASGALAAFATAAASAQALTPAQPGHPRCTCVVVLPGDNGHRASPGGRERVPARRHTFLDPQRVPRRHTLRPGDTPRAPAKKYLKTYSAWRAILQANRIAGLHDDSDPFAWGKRHHRRIIVIPLQRTPRLDGRPIGDPLRPGTGGRH